MPWWPTELALAVLPFCREFGRWRFYGLSNGWWYVGFGFDYRKKQLWSSYSWYVNLDAIGNVIPGLVLKGAMHRGVPRNYCGIFEGAGENFGKANPAATSSRWFEWPKRDLWLLQDSRTPWKEERNIHWSEWRVYIFYGKGLSSRWHSSRKPCLWLNTLLGFAANVALNFKYRWNWKKSRQFYAVRKVGKFYWNRFSRLPNAALRDPIVFIQKN